MKTAQKGSALEQTARRLWQAWGEFRRYTLCDECGEARYCHAARRRGRFLCLDCFDLSREADRFAGRETWQQFTRLLKASDGDEEHARHIQDTIKKTRTDAA